jgi:hypothetical protein
MSSDNVSGSEESDKTTSFVAVSDASNSLLVTIVSAVSKLSKHETSDTAHQHVAQKIGHLGAIRLCISPFGPEFSTK